ncbi:polysaccharide biosynthesis tyrosine autokinase [Mucilaginibacter daejeonensis]|uniref:GumC family protein n=1 Tax=Mucilaginibacter daejeonensis TaxID=398049 RepID=UPI001D17BDC3|nr:tyrosine-protein kinase [Mucilaginibacter daejeonensis]UEG52661.1 polysaccharide biosynthesis tyrosine autokinase [Mucilaginibacter daejeonensis]
MNEEDLYEDDGQEGAEKGPGLIEVIFTYLKYWYWFLISLTIFLVIGYFYVKIQVPQYSTQAQILIKDNSKQLTDQVVFEELNITPPGSTVDNEILILRSPTLVEVTIKELDLQTSYYAKGPLNDRILYSNVPAKIEVIQPSDKTYSVDWPVQLSNNSEALFDGKRVSLGAPVNTPAGVIKITVNRLSFSTIPYFVKFSKVGDVAGEYINKTGVAPVAKGSNILLLTTENAVPKRGEDFLNKLIKNYITASTDDKTKNITSAVNFINDRIKELAIELDAENKNVENFKISNNITDLSKESEDIYKHISSNDERVAEIDLELNILRNIESFLARTDNVDVTQPSMIGLTESTVTGQVAQLADLLLKKKNLLTTVPETNPLIVSINDQILSLKQTLSGTIKTVRSNLLLSQRTLKQQSANFTGQLKNVPIKERQLLDVMRNQGVKNTLFNFLLQKREETQLTLASNTSDVRIINAASTGGKPIKPVKSSLYMIFFALGLGIPFGVVFIKEMLNNTVRRRSDIIKATKVPVIAQISHSDDIDPLTIVSKPKSIIAEQIRALRTNLDFLVPGPGPKALLFTSAHSGEGKSFISLNLGASLASTGKKVIILELDLRKPKLLSTLGLDKRTGLSDYLIGKIDYKDIVRKVPQQENFYLIESGTIPPNPAEILMGKYLQQLITELRKEYDYILIDAPPIGLVTDAQILSQYADITFFLVRHNFTRKDQIELVNELNRKKIFRNMNIIFNSIDTSSFGYGYRYDYSYYGEQPRGNKGLMRFFKRSGKK